MSKFSRPVLTDIHPRRRLFGMLDRMRSLPLIWVSGPGGSGKTTLVGSYLEDRKIPCLWYQVDEGDKEPATFFHYLGLAAKRFSPRKKTTLPAFTQDFAQGLPAFSQWYFEKLFALLNHPPSSPKKGELRGDFLLVFDNFHEVPEGSPLPEILLGGLSRIPEGARVIVLSRSDPPPALVRLRANEQMGNIEWADLRLDLSETEGIIRLRNPGAESADSVRQLHTASDGWTAGLILILQKAQRERAAPEILKNLGKEEIFEYFAGEIFRRADSAYKDFLLQTALFPRMTAGMAEELTGIASAGQILSALSRNNFFTEKRLQEEPTYQYHPLFREFLVAQGRKFFAQERLQAIIREAAFCLEKNNQVEDAVHLLLEIKDWENVLPLVLKHAPALNVQGRHVLLEEWIGSFPREILENQPWLLYWLGVSKYLFSPSLAKAYFEMAFERFYHDKDLHGVLSSAIRLLGAIEYEGLDYGLMKRPLAILQKISGETKKLSSPQDEFLLSFNIFFAMFYTEPHNPEIESWEEKVLSLLGNAPEPFLRALSLSILTYFRMYLGDFRRASKTLLLLRMFLQSEEAPLISRIKSRECEIAFCLLTGSREEGLKAASESLKVAQATGARLAAVRILGNKAYILMANRDFRGASDLLDQVTPLLGIMNPVNVSFYHIIKARISQGLGDPEEALFHADLVLKMAVESNNIWWQLPGLISKAYILHQLGRKEEAEDHLARVAQTAPKIRSRLWEFVAELAGALFSLERGNERKAVQLLRRAMAMGSEGGFFSTHLYQPDGLSMLCEKALEAGLEPDYAKEFIRRLKLLPPESSPSSEKWPWPLKITTLGQFGVWVDEKPIQFSRKGQQKPLALLKVLIALGGKGIKAEQVSDLLWPGADGDDAYHSLLTNLHRLRKLIAHENTFHFSEGRLSMDDRSCWVDAWAFERLLEEAESERKKGAFSKAVHYIEKAASLYKGPFLSGEIDEPWLISPRERLKSKFVRGLSWLGSHWQKSKEWEKAIESYLRGLEIDDLAEELYRELMTCYQRLGRRAEALSTYQRCRKTLEATLGIEPSQETMKIYKSLIL